MAIGPHVVLTRAHPATPHLAGIVCGSCVLFAWTVCLIYWYLNRRRERREELAEKEKELEAQDTLEIPVPPIRRARTRSKSPDTRRKYPPGTRVLGDKKKSKEDVTPRQNPTSAAGTEKRKSPPVGYLTPMTEVPTRDEARGRGTTDKSLPVTPS